MPRVWTGDIEPCKRPIRSLHGQVGCKRFHGPEYGARVVSFAQQMCMAFGRGHAAPQDSPDRGHQLLFMGRGKNRTPRTRRGIEVERGPARAAHRLHDPEDRDGQFRTVIIAEMPQADGDGAEPALPGGVCEALEVVTRDTQNGAVVAAVPKCRDRSTLFCGRAVTARGITRAGHCSMLRFWRRGDCISMRIGMRGAKTGTAKARLSGQGGASLLDTGNVRTGVASAHSEPRRWVCAKNIKEGINSMRHASGSCSTRT